MASSSSKRKNARGREEMAAITNDAMRFVEMAKDSDVNSKFLLDKATEAMGMVYQSLQTSTKHGKIPRDQITGEITTCDPQHKDGYNWAKYGEKKNKEFNDNPKNYYNCSNKRKNGCPAKRHVQQVNSHEYRIIYYGSHTCGIQNQQQHHSPPLNPSEHGSASAVQNPNISSSITATPSSEPAGQNSEDDDGFWNTFLSSCEEMDLDSVLRCT